jgi:glycosyltransferase involved in cell wall biosynthesis
LPVSVFTKNLLIKHGVAPKKIMVVHNALDIGVFDYASRTAQITFNRYPGIPTVVLIANLAPVKGHEYYLKAATQILKSHNAMFYVIGDGPRRAYLEQLVHELGVEKNVVFTGRISWPEIYYILSHFVDICVSSSVSENFPYYILECMAANKPVVATDVGGVSEVVFDGMNGYLVPPKDSESLSKAIITLIDNPDKAKQMGMEGRKFVEQKFNMALLVEKLSEIYEHSKVSCSIDR